MTPPPIGIRNFITGGSYQALETPDVSASMQRLQRLSQLGQLSRQAQALQQEAAALRLTTQGHQPHGEAILQGYSGRTLADLRPLLAGLQLAAQAGNRESYFRAMQLSFVLVHLSLANPESRDESVAFTAQSAELLREYARFIRNSSALSPEEKLRYLFAAAQVARDILGRTAGDASIDGMQGAREDLSAALRDAYTQLQSHHTAHVTANPAGNQYLGILREIQMRQALLQGNLETARQRAMELAEHYAAHPPPEPNPADPASNNWDHRAARAIARDAEFIQMVGQLNVISGAEDTVATVNGLSYEALQVICSTIDQANEEEVEAIRSRYLALSAAVTALLFTRPGLTLQQVLQALRDPQQARTLRQELELASQQNPSLSELITQARGEQDLEALVRSAQAAAAHVLGLSEGAGRSLLEHLFSQNQLLNPIAQVARRLEAQPDLVRALGLRAVPGSPLPVNTQYAVELLRRGPAGLRAVQTYAAAHQSSATDAIIAALQQSGNTQESVNSLIQEMLAASQLEIDDQPDHVVAAVYNLVHVIAETGEVAPGVSVRQELRNQARQFAQQMDGFSFRAGRVAHHLTSVSSLATLGAGILLAEFLPILLISRAGAAGTLTRGGLQLVNGGRLTYTGSMATGLATGLTMSVVGTTLHTRERSAQGLTTHFGRDLATSAAINGFTFAATIPIARLWSNVLAPTAGEATAVGRITGWRRFFLHGGIAVAGGTIALGTGMLFRYGNTGEFTTSWDEVAENYLSILMWELGAAGVRRVRQRFGLAAELQGAPVFEADSLEPNAGAVRRIHHRLARGFARLGNGMLSNLGEARTRRINEVADRIVQEMLETIPAAGSSDGARGPTAIRSHRFREQIARQIALEELSSPGRLDHYHDGFFARMLPMIAGEEGSHRLIFIPRQNLFTTSVESGFAPPPPPSQIREEVVPQRTSRSVERPRPIEEREQPLRTEFDRPAAPPVRGRRPVAAVELVPPADQQQEPQAPARQTAMAPPPPPEARRAPVLWNRETLDGLIQHPHHRSHLTRASDLLREAGADGRSREVYMVVDPSDHWVSISLEPNSRQAQQGRNRFELAGTYQPGEHRVIFPPLHGERAPIVLELNTKLFRVQTLPPPPNPGTGSGQPRPPQPASEVRPPVESAPSQVTQILAPSRAQAPEPPADTRVPGARTVFGMPAGGDEAVPAARPSSEARTVLGISPDLPVMRPREVRLAAREAPGQAREAHDLVRTPQGEIAAFTEIGFDKSPARDRNPQQRLGVGVNEDAYGITVDPMGRTVVVVADGMGGHGSGDRASSRAVETIVQAVQDPLVTLGETFLAAHQAIVQDRHGGGTVASAFRVNPDGSVDVAQTGDTMIYILRRNADGSHQIHRAFYPGNIAGQIRGASPTMSPGSSVPRIADTIGMNASDVAHRVTGALGQAGHAPRISQELVHGAPSGIYEGLLTIPSPNGDGTRVPVVLREGDGLLVVSDGIGDIFNVAQLTSSTTGREGTHAISEALYYETLSRLELFIRSLALRPGQRIRIQDGSFQGNYLERADSGAEVYDQPTGGNHIGHIHGDNITGLLFRYLPNGSTAEGAR